MCDKIKTEHSVYLTNQIRRCPRAFWPSDVIGGGGGGVLHSHSETRSCLFVVAVTLSCWLLLPQSLWHWFPFRGLNRCDQNAGEQFTSRITLHQICRNYTTTYYAPACLHHQQCVFGCVCCISIHVLMIESIVNYFTPMPRNNIEFLKHSTTNNCNNGPILRRDNAQYDQR